MRLPTVKKNILLFNLAVDERDPVLGFAVPFIARMARDVDRIDIITVRSGVYSLPAHVSVRSMSRDRHSKLISIFLFYRHLFTVLRRGRYDFCFSHMNPLCVVLAWPFLWLAGVPIVIWHANKGGGFISRIAHYAASLVVTSGSMSYPWNDSKVKVVGQMIDTNMFRPYDGYVPDSPPLFISVGRISPIKDILTLVRAAAIMRKRGFDFTCVLIGPELPLDREYAARVRSEIKVLGLTSYFSFIGALTYREMPDYYRRAFLHINASPLGAFDKAALEAAASGTLSVAANPAIGEFFGTWAESLCFEYGNPESLADRISALLAKSPTALHDLRNGIRESVCRSAGIEAFMVRFWEVTDIIKKIS